MEDADVDRWAAAQCLAHSGTCDSDVVGEMVQQLLNTDDPIRYEQAQHLLGKLSQNSVRMLFFCSSLWLVEFGYSIIFTFSVIFSL